MKLEECLKRLNELMMRDAELKDDGYDIQVLQVAIESVKKQIPVVPRFKKDEDWDRIFNVDTSYFCCPTCGRKVEEYEHHCRCGQKFSWNEVW